MLYWFIWINEVVSGAFFSKLFIFVFSVLNFVFLTTSLVTTSVNFFGNTGTVFNLTTYKSPTIVFKLFILVGALTNLLMSSLWTSAFIAIKSFLSAK